MTTPAPQPTDNRTHDATEPTPAPPDLEPIPPYVAPAAFMVTLGNGLAAVRRQQRASRLLWLRRWRRMKPAQQLILGFFSYVVIGTLALMLPLAQSTPTGLLDNLFTVTSAVSTTGLTTVSVSESYSFFGELVLVVLFQLGGIGYMTVSSFIMLARGQRLNDTRLGVLRAGFTLPEGLDLVRFIRRVVIFTFAIEAVGVVMLYFEFRAYDVADPLWSAVFHTVSAFATAGFSLNNNSLEPFRDSWIVNLTIGGLSYLGAIGFIVLQDAWQAVRSRARRITFTSKVILVSTAIIFILGTLLLFFFEPTIRELPLESRLLASMFQIMTASSTAGFNTVPISAIGAASLMLILAAMIIGASPSGTGGGIKTTSASALSAVVLSIFRGRSEVTLFGHEVPLPRVLNAAAATTFYLVLLSLGIFALGVSEGIDFAKLAFEAVSAIGTVGLSMGITADLTPLGKCIIIALMFIGRVGPLTLGLALMHTGEPAPERPAADLAV